MAGVMSMSQTSVTGNANVIVVTSDASNKFFLGKNCNIL